MEQILFFMLGILLVSVSVLTVVVVRGASRVREIENENIKRSFNDNEIINNIYSTMDGRVEMINRNLVDVERNIHDSTSSILSDLRDLDRSVDSRIDKLLNKLK